MRPLWMEFPTLSEIFATDHQFMVGSDILVQPVVQPNIVQSTVYLPDSHTVWYDFWSFQKFHGGSAYEISSPLSSIPVFQRGGSIIPKKIRIRRSSQLMKHDPYSLFIALNDEKTASGTLYLDDELTMAYQDGKSTLRAFAWENGILSCTGPISSSYSSTNTLERIVVFGLGQNPTFVRVQDTTLTHTYDTAQDILIIRKPNVLVGSDWSMHVEN